MSRKESFFHKLNSVCFVLCFFSIAFLLYGAAHAATSPEEGTVSETDAASATSPEEDTASETDAASVETTTENTDSIEAKEESAISSDSSAMSMLSSEDDPDGTGDLSAPNSQVSEFSDAAVFSGAAVWRIPIAVPPGRNNLAPKIALVYNSQRKNGWVGVG